MNAITPVEAIAAETASSLDALIQDRDTPLVIRGLCRDWPLVQAGLRSDDEAARLLLEGYRGDPVIAYYLPPEQKGRVFYNEAMDGFNYQAGKLPLAKVLDTLFAQQGQADPAGVYVGSTDLDHYFPGLAPTHRLSLEGVRPMAHLWLGNRARIAAHFDFPHNLACNLVGRRTFTLFPPEQVKNLYIGPMEFAPGGQDISLVDFDAPDLERFPRFAEAQAAALTAELAPGDVLFLPSMWWHHVRSEADFNVLLTHWWRDTPGYLGRPNNALLHGILALRSLPKAQRQAWKAMFDHYVFDAEPEDLAHLPEAARGWLSTPLDEMNARKLRADLTNKLKR
ncbi:cupin-like domain-containing protein [Ferrimonas balearica]|uniref:cupin-like domain-containing protein n=1 Tax=Ferrimonas balearica TaxID=44012 RepID=UPI001C9989B5|nr:cupin-like domain-containing protein [Ferrimonas balearica]MBY5993983.1 cupin-like domain-containing protein [Ferrimonas balearica]